MVLLEEDGNDDGRAILEEDETEVVRAMVEEDGIDIGRVILEEDETEVGRAMVEEDGIDIGQAMVEEDETYVKRAMLEEEGIDIGRAMVEEDETEVGLVILEEFETRFCFELKTGIFEGLKFKVDCLLRFILEIVFVVMELQRADIGVNATLFMHKTKWLGLS